MEWINSTSVISLFELARKIESLFFFGVSLSPFSSAPGKAWPIVLLELSSPLWPNSSIIIDQYQLSQLM